MLNVVYIECGKEDPNAEYRYAECRGATLCVHVDATQQKHISAESKLSLKKLYSIGPWYIIIFFYHHHLSECLRGQSGWAKSDSY